jgi:transposase
VYAVDPTTASEVIPMPTKKAYRALPVKLLDSHSLAQQRPGQAITLGIDVAKHHLFAVLRWHDGTSERPWRIAYPREVPLLIDHLRVLADRHALRIGIEPTGTYADPLRARLAQAGLSVCRVGCKEAHDYAEVFDGVPSQHDGKDAAILAELVALGKAEPWPPPRPCHRRQRLHAWVDWLCLHQQEAGRWLNRIEALLARHWPEATAVLPLTSQALLRLLARWGGPRAWAADATGCRQLQSWGGARLSAAKVGSLAESARHGLGVAQTESDRRLLAAYARRALAARRQVLRSRRRLRQLARGEEELRRQAEAVGEVTACVLWACVGPASQYGSAAAYRKALGLNLREFSSGCWKGRLRLSKRGSARARRWLYYAALRLVQQPAVREWYRRQRASKGCGGKAVLVALMRKLALALYRVGAQGRAFSRERLVGSSPGVAECPPARPAAQAVGKPGGCEAGKEVSTTALRLPVSSYQHKSCGKSPDGAR